jgi:predicted ATPase/DNA-binding SARP family transcriptional activator
VRKNRTMRYGVLGPVQVCDANGDQRAVGGPGVRALLARLLLDAGHQVSAGRLVSDLYGDRAPAGAANALQSQVSRLRRTLPEGAEVELHPAGYRLAVEPDHVDVHRFTRLASEGSAAATGGDHARARELFDEALRQWRGPALADVTDAPFAHVDAARLEEMRLAVVEDRVEARLHLGDAADLIAELSRLVHQHPLRERLCGQLMRALHGAGRQAEALAVFETTRRRLADEFGADPSPALAAVHVAILRGELTPPPATVRPRPLPAQLTSFLGREQELDRVSKLLGEARLVTLTGPGGAGKTRLAIEAATRQDTEQAFVDLVPLTGGADLAPALLGALGLRDAGLRAPATADHPDPVERIAAATAGRPVLLVLDNCEHVIGDVAAFTGRLLATCPQLRILATSREPLGLAGEALYPVSGLAVPPPEASPAQVADFAAVRLFVDRAARAAPGRALDDLAAVRRICAVLDGLPLGIELAVARLRTLPVADLAGRLDDRLTLLSRGEQAGHPRHRTLRAVVEWSWQLLDDAEHVLARRLAVFAAGASLDAVEQVCGASVSALASLVDKSLVEVSAGRYRMLETVRAYAAEQLAAAGEADRLRRAHAAYFLDLAWRADGHLRRAEQLDWLARLDAERGNLHAALRAAAAAADVTTALDLVAALAFYWWLRGLRGEAATLAGEALAAAGPRRPSGREDQHALCELFASLGGPDDPDRHHRLRNAAETVHQLRRPPRQPFALLLSSMVAGPPAGGPAAVQALVEDKEELLGADPWMRALSPLGLATVRMLAGELSEAERGATESLQRFRTLGERWGTVTALGLLAEIAGARGERARAVELMDEALQLAAELGSAVDMAEMLRVRGEGRLQAGDLDGAQEDYHRMADEARRAGAPELLAASQLGLAEVAGRRGEAAEARRRAETALADCPTGWFSAEETRRAILDALRRL